MSGLSAIHCCRIRVTRLDSTGAPVAEPNNVYVSDKPVQVQVTPQIEAGRDLTLVGGCDCIVAQYRGNDKLKFFTLELDRAAIEPALEEMMLGASVILDGVDPIGVWWPSEQTFDCSNEVQPNLAFEAWQDLWEDDHQAPSPHRYVHWVWPSSRWQISAHTLQNDFMQPKVNGFTRGNPLWGAGIYGDYPEAAEANGGYFYTDSIPTAFDGYQTVAP